MDDTAGQTIRVTLYISKSADPHLYEYLEGFHTRRRAERLRQLSETGLAALKSNNAQIAEPIQTGSHEQKPVHEPILAASGYDSMKDDVDELL